MKTGLTWKLFALAAILMSQPVEAVAASRGTTVRSDILPSNSGQPGEVLVRHVRFNWGQFRDAVIEIVAYSSQEAARQAARDFAASACSQWRMNQVLITGTLFIQPERQNCAAGPSSHCFALPEGSSATAAMPASARCYKAQR